MPEAVTSVAGFKIVVYHGHVRELWIPDGQIPNGFRYSPPSHSACYPPPPPPPAPAPAPPPLAPALPPLPVSPVAAAGIVV